MKPVRWQINGREWKNRVVHMDDASLISFITVGVGFACVALLIHSNPLVLSFFSPLLLSVMQYCSSAVCVAEES